MTKKTILFFFFFYINLIYSQRTLEVTYETYLLDESEKPVAISFLKNKLITNQEVSLYYSLLKDTIVGYDGGQYIMEYPEYFDKTKAKGDIAFKILKKNTYLSRDEILKKTIIDTDYKINWQITKNEKVLLGYSCQEAFCFYRGRNYKAYFSSEIPYSNGPFKFDGLPGLILEIISDDEAVRIFTKEIKLTDEKIENPFLNEKDFISWDGFKKLWRAYSEKQNSYHRSVGATEDLVPNRGIEYYD